MKKRNQQSKTLIIHSIHDIASHHPIMRCSTQNQPRPAICYAGENVIARSLHCELLLAEDLRQQIDSFDFILSYVALV
jgi:hypothetical protein